MNEPSLRVSLALLFGIVIGGATADFLTGLADLIAAGGVLGGFIGGAVAVVRRADPEETAQIASRGAVLGGVLGLVAYLIDRVAGG